MIVSIFGLLSALIYELLSFQQVIQQGVSVHIIWTSEQPFAGYVYFIKWSSAGDMNLPLPYQPIGGFRIASWIRFLGMICFAVIPLCVGGGVSGCGTFAGIRIPETWTKGVPSAPMLS